MTFEIYEKEKKKKKEEEKKISNERLNNDYSFLEADIDMKN